MINWEKVLEIAGHVTHPVAAAVFVAVLATFLLFWGLYRTNKPLSLCIFVILAIILVVLGLAPLASSTFLQSRGLYRVRVIILGPDHLPLDDAHLTSSIGGEPKRIEGGWEFDIPPQSISADRTAMFYASKKDAFLTGKSQLTFGRDYFPTTTIQLSSDTSAVLRGVVIDERRRSVFDATVTIEGYPDEAVTDKQGNFSLSAHAAEGQIVQVRAQKGQLVGTLSVPAGQTPVEIMVKRP